MEMSIENFVRINTGNGHGSIWSCGSGRGCCDGYGSNDGYGSGHTYCYGYSSGSVSGCGKYNGLGKGDGEATGNGDKNGTGYGRGYDYGLKSINGNKIYYIDNLPTVVTHVKGNIAKGYFVRSDLLLEPCFIVKENNCFAHGYTLHDAFQSLQEKLYDDSTEEERIALFKSKFTDYSAKYPAKELFYWPIY